MLRYPGLWTKFPKLKKKYGGKTYAELVMRIEADSLVAKTVRTILKGRYGRISLDGLMFALRRWKVRAKKDVVRFLLNLRELYRLPAPNGALIGPYHDNPIMTLLGTYGPLRWDRIVLWLQDVEFRDPVELLASVYDRVLLRHSRGLDRRRMEILKYAKGPSGRYIILTKDLPFSERHEKRNVPAVELSKILSDDTVIIPTW